ncbi:MAG: hypothetical protein EXQ49_04460 [Acidobacteria bacterium]|nr:hypothetical protein [Acidobacteriota bacterium]
MPNYDIGGVRLVCPGVPCGVFAGFSTAPAAPAPGKFGGHGFPPGIDIGRVGANRGLVDPLVRVQPLRVFKQPVAFLRGTRATRDTVIEVGKPGSQHSGRRRAHGLAQQGLVHDFNRWRGHRRGVFALAAGRTIATVLRPLAWTAVARIRSRSWHRLAQQTHPIKRNIGVRVLKHLAHFSIKRLAADLHVGW